MAGRGASAYSQDCATLVPECFTFAAYRSGRPAISGHDSLAYAARCAALLLPVTGRNGKRMKPGYKLTGMRGRYAGVIRDDNKNIVWTCGHLHQWPRGIGLYRDATSCATIALKNGVLLRKDDTSAD